MKVCSKAQYLDMEKWNFMFSLIQIDQLKSGIFKFTKKYKPNHNQNAYIYIYFQTINYYIM